MSEGFELTALELALLDAAVAEVNQATLELGQRLEVGEAQDPCDPVLTRLKQR